MLVSVLYTVVLALFLCALFFFFFKQKTAYEMRISDWSSDVCSSDLLLPRCPRGQADDAGSAGGAHEALHQPAPGGLSRLRSQRLRQGRRALRARRRPPVASTAMPEIPAAPLNLTDRTVLVTGGNGGIGLGMASACGAAGAQIVIWGRDEAKNEGAVAGPRAAGIPPQTRKNGGEG